MILADFLNDLFMLALALFTVRFIQAQISPDSEFGKALAYIFH